MLLQCVVIMLLRKSRVYIYFTTGSDSEVVRYLATGNNTKRVWLGGINRLPVDIIGASTPNFLPNTT